MSRGIKQMNTVCQLCWGK